MEILKIKTPKGLRKIGPGHPTFIIAEMSGNHKQSFARAKKIVKAAADAGVDAIKLQTYTADTITLNCDAKYFQVTKSKLWKGQSLYALYQKAYTPWEWQPKLKKYAEDLGIICFSTPFDATAVDFLEKMKVSVYKVASFEVVDIPLLKRIAQTKKPVIMSRGMASVEEVRYAINYLKKNGCPAVAVLHCISSYPAELKDMNIATVPDIAKKFNLVSGLSDHSLGKQASLTAVAMGGSIIEKHITLSRTDGSIDGAFSLEPKECKDLVGQIRNLELSIGKPKYKISKSESESVLHRKSLFVAQDIKKGEEITPQNVRSVRPGHGLSPRYYYKVMGKISRKNLKKGTPLKFDMLAM